ncbi:MAG: hypothetical protein HYW86_00180 [Candidatus Roizmanbacteria bacterium]|nr:MAG: hypothetical protein HYW86_00180 [Candidatus Roizmanbacteria bacterium]
MSTISAVETTALIGKTNPHTAVDKVEPIPDHAETINSWQDFTEILGRYKPENFRNSQCVLADREGNEIKSIVNKILAKMKTTKGKVDQVEMVKSFLNHYPDLGVVEKIEFLPDIDEFRKMINNYNFEAAYKDKGALAKSQTKILLDYLEGPVITDTITDHAMDRRGWRTLMDQLHPGFNDFYSSNRLKMNRFTGAEGALQLITGRRSFFTLAELDWFKQNIADRAKELVYLNYGILIKPDGTTEKTVPYDQLPLPEKLKVVSRMDSLMKNAVSFICSVSRRASSSETFQEAA